MSEGIQPENRSGNPGPGSTRVPRYQHPPKTDRELAGQENSEQPPAEPCAGSPFGMTRHRFRLGSKIIEIDVMELTEADEAASPLDPAWSQCRRHGFVRAVRFHD